jgi:hypothetical protein
MKSLLLLLLCLLLSSSLTVTAGNKELPDGLKKSLGIVKLPPVEKRKIIGTWYDSDFDCTRSFEQVGSRYYVVLRFKDGSGGKEGTQISRVNSSTFRPIPSRSSGDHYVIQKNGDLASRDNDGLIDTLPKYSSLWPKTAPPKARRPVDEDNRTKGLSCYDIGYRYGYGAIRSMKGQPVNPSSDIAVPERCRNDPSTQSGITAGGRAAW